MEFVGTGRKEMSDKERMEIQMSKLDNRKKEGLPDPKLAHRSDSENWSFLTFNRFNRLWLSFVIIPMLKLLRTAYRFSVQSFDPSKNYYQILNVEESASQEAIKTSYKALAKRYHPDFNKGKEEQFK